MKKGSVEENSRKRKEEKMQEISNTWDSEKDWLKANFNPFEQTVERFLPQFYADYKHKIRLAQLFSCPINELMLRTYDQRIEMWARNIVTTFGNSCSSSNYQSWVNNRDSF